MTNGTYHCNDCNEGYDGYHDCDWGDDKVEFVCNDCGEHINREVYDTDIEGVTPQRCASCTLERMKKA